MKALERSWLLPTYGSCSFETNSLIANHSVLSSLIESKISALLFLYGIGPMKGISFDSRRCNAQVTEYRLQIESIKVDNWKAFLQKLNVTLPIQDVTILNFKKEIENLSLEFKLNFDASKEAICINTISFHTEAFHHFNDVITNAIRTRIPDEICIPLGKKVCGPRVVWEGMHWKSPSRIIGQKAIGNSQYRLIRLMSDGKISWADDRGQIKKVIRVTTIKMTHLGNVEVQGYINGKLSELDFHVDPGEVPQFTQALNVFQTFLS